MSSVVRRTAEDWAEFFVGHQPLLTTYALAFAIGAVRISVAVAGPIEEDVVKVRFDLWFVSIGDSDRAPETDGGSPREKTDDESGGIVATVVVGEEFELQGHTLVVKAGTIVPLDADEERRSQVHLLASPAVLTVVGQEAEIAIGEPIMFMVRNDDGTLLEKTVDGLTEGVTVRLVADEATATRVSVERLDIEFRRVIARGEIPGVRMRVGRPVIKTTVVSSALVLAVDQLAIISLPSIADSSDRVFAVIQATIEE